MNCFMNYKGQVMSSDRQKGARDDDGYGGGDNAVAVKPKHKIKKPKMYKVILLNDDFTPMDFVVQILVNIFHKSLEQANEIMLKVHNKGAAVCGVYPYEVAEIKVFEVLNLAQKYEHPLQCLMEKAE